jgi:hypothetical protein
MECEKLMYWTTLGVLALATTTGFVTEHRGWGDLLAERSLALVSQASEVAANYVDHAGIAGMVMGRGENSLEGHRVSGIVVPGDLQRDVQRRVQTSLACAQRTLVRHQAEMARMQAMSFRVRTLKLVPRTIVLPDRNLVIEVPQIPETPNDTF